MWRDIGRQLRLWGLDGRVIFLALILAYHPRWWTLYLFLAGVCFLWLMERRGYTLANAWRRLQVFIAGSYRPAITIRRRGRSDR